MLKYNIKIVTILLLILMGLSCDTEDVLSSLGDGNYELNLIIDGEQPAYYADSCKDCDDRNPIIFKATLTKNNAPASGETIVFTYESPTITTSLYNAFEYQPNWTKTDANGNIQILYNDEGQAGEIKVFAQYFSDLYPEELAWKDSTETINLEGYWTLARGITVFSNSNAIIAGLETSFIEVNASITDISDEPLENMAVKFTKDGDDNQAIFYNIEGGSNPDEVYTNALGIASVLIKIDNQNAFEMLADDLGNSGEFTITAALNYDIIDPADLDSIPIANTLNIKVNELPIPAYSLELTNLSISSAPVDTNYYNIIVVDSDTSLVLVEFDDGTDPGEYEAISDTTIFTPIFYADGDAPAGDIILQARLLDGNQPVQDQSINFSLDGSADAYFEPIDALTQGNGTFKIRLNDGLDDALISITASFVDYTIGSGATDTASINIRPYFEDNWNVDLWPADNIIISGINNETVDSTMLIAAIKDVNSIPLKNVEVIFGIEEFNAYECNDVDGEDELITIDTFNSLEDCIDGNCLDCTIIIPGEALGDLLPPIIALTDDAGQAFVDYRARPNTKGGYAEVSLHVSADISDTLSRTTTFDINRPIFDYDLTLVKNDIDNYSDNNATITRLTATLKYGTGDAIEGAELAILIENDESDTPYGDYEYVNGSTTDFNGQTIFDFHDNGEAGNITITVSYTDIYQNPTESETTTFTVNPIENLVEFLHITPYPQNLIIYEDTPDIDDSGNNVYNLQFTANTGVPGVPITFTQLSYIDNNTGLPMPSPSTLSFVPLNPVITNEDGQAIIIAPVYENDHLNTTITMEAAIGPNSENIWDCYGNCPAVSAISVLTRPQHYYLLTLDLVNEDNNYSDNNLTTSVFRARLKECEFPLDTHPDCENGQLLSNETLNIEYGTSGSIIHLNDSDEPITDANGILDFEFLDNGQAGENEIIVSYADGLGNSVTTNISLTIYPIEDLVETVSLSSSSSGTVIYDDAYNQHIETITVTVNDDNGASVQNVTVNFINGSDTTNTLGSLSSESCVTEPNGQCSVELTTNIPDLESGVTNVAEITACVDTEELTLASQLSGGQLQFSRLKGSNVSSFISSKKNKKSTKNNFSIRSLFSNENTAYSAVDCGTSGTEFIEFIEQDLYYTNQVEFLELYVNYQNLIVDADSTDKEYLIQFTANAGIGNVPIMFNNSNSDVASFSPLNPVLTNENGEAIITATITQVQAGSSILMEASIEGTLFTATKTCNITYEVHEYELTLNQDDSGEINYSDNNLTATLFDLTLKEDGELLPNRIIQLEFVNSLYNTPEGIIVYENESNEPITDVNGNLRFRFNDNGQLGEITITASYFDEFGNTATTTGSFVIAPVENLVETVSLSSASSGTVIYDDENNQYIETITVTVNDDNGASVQNITVNFINGSDTTNTLGSLSSDYCTTQSNGQCSIQLTANIPDLQSEVINVAEVTACVDTDELILASQLSGGYLEFSKLKGSNVPSIISSKKNKKATKNNFSIRSIFSNENTTFSTVNCGTSGTEFIQFIEQDLDNASQVSSLELSVSAGQIIIDNVNITVSDTIWVWALNENGTGVANAPILFRKVTDGFGTISEDFVYTDENGYAQTIYTSGMQDNVEDEVEIVIQAEVQHFSELVETETITINFEGSINAELDVASFGLSDDSDYILTTDIGNQNIYLQDTTHQFIAACKNESGVGINNVPVYFKLLSSTYGEANGGINSALEYTGLNNLDSTSSLGNATVYYTNTSGGDDILYSFILNPITNDTLFIDSTQIHTLPITAYNSYQLASFSFYDGISEGETNTYYHEVGSSSEISTISTNSNGIGLGDVPIKYSLKEPFWGVLSNDEVLSFAEGTFTEVVVNDTVSQFLPNQPGISKVIYSNPTISNDLLEDIIYGWVSDPETGEILHIDSMKVITPPSYVPDYSFELELISDSPFYSDYDAKDIIFQATLKDGGSPVVGETVSFSYENIDGSSIINASFENIDIVTQSNGTFRMNLNDYGDHGEIIVTASVPNLAAYDLNKSDTITITPYIEAVETVLAWTADNRIISGVDDLTNEGTTILAQIQDENGYPLQNVEVIFGLEETAGENLGFFTSGFVTLTDSLGQTSVNYLANLNSDGGNVNVNVAIVDDIEGSTNTATVPITVEPLNFDYCLFLEFDNTPNYSDINITKTLLEAQLIQISCTSDDLATCCADSSLIANGDPVTGASLTPTFTNSNYNISQGEIQYIDSSTDANGSMQFEFLDNGQDGEIAINLSYTDQYGFSPLDASTTFTILPIENMVAEMTLAANTNDQQAVPSYFIIDPDTTTNCETTFSVTLRDNSGTAVQNVNVNFINGSDNNDPLGALAAPGSCTTDVNGNCNILLNSLPDQFGDAEIISCVTTEELATAYALSGQAYDFPFFQENSTNKIKATKINKRKKKNTANIYKPLTIDQTKQANQFNFPYIQNQSVNIDSINIAALCTDPDGDGILNGIGASATVTYLTQQQYNINQVTAIDSWIIVGEIIENNVNVTVIDSIHIRTMDQYGSPVANVPVIFTKETVGFGYLDIIDPDGSASSTSETGNAITDSTGTAIAIYYPNIEGYDGDEEYVPINFNVGMLNSAVTAEFSINLEIENYANVEYEVASFDNQVESASTTPGDTKLFNVLARDASGVGVCGVPVYWSLVNVNSPGPPSGLLEDEITYTSCDANPDSTNATNAESGWATIQYSALPGTGDTLFSRIYDPILADSILFSDTTYININNINQVTLMSNPTDSSGFSDHYIIGNDQETTCETIFSASVKDDSGIGVNDVEVNFYNQWQYGALDVPGSCVTDSTGSCNITLTSSPEEFGDAEIISCVTIDELETAYSLSNGSYNFSFFEENFNYENRSSSKSNTKMKNETNIYKPFTLNQSKLSNQLNILNSENQTTNINNICTDPDGDGNINGIGASATVTYLTEHQYNINQVKLLDSWVIASEIIENNVNVTVIDSIFIQATDSLGVPVANVPVIFTKETDGFGYLEIISEDGGISLPGETGNAITDSTGIAMAVYHPSIENYQGEDSYVTIDFNVGMLNSLVTTDIEIELEIENFENIEYEVAFLDGEGWKQYACINLPNDFYLDPLCDNTCIIDECIPSITTFNVSPSDTTITFRVLTKDESGVGVNNVPVYWSLQGIPTGLLHDEITYSTSDSTNTDNTGGNPENNNVLDPGWATVEYDIFPGASDTLIARIYDPFNVDSVLVADTTYIKINNNHSIMGYSANSSINVTSLDSVFCDTLFAHVRDIAGNAVPNVPIEFSLNPELTEGIIYQVQPQTGSQGEDARARYCPDQQFIGDVIVVASADQGALTDTIQFSYIDAIPECPGCVPQLTIVSDEYVLPYGNPDTTSCMLTATMTDSTGNEPPVNTLVEWQAIQLDENDEWTGVGSIDPYSLFAANELTGAIEATATFQMMDAAGLITVVATSESLTDTLELITISSIPAYIEILPPEPNEIMVQGGGGQESTDIEVAIRDGSGNYVTIPYWIRFNLVGYPEGTHMNGDDDSDNIIDVLSLNGISTVSINAGNMPGAVQLKVELFPDLNEQIDDTDEPITEALGTPVTVATGPPAQGAINYSYVDIEAIGGGFYQVPIAISLWDVHSNPVDDSTNVYLSIRGIADVYDNTAEYFDGNTVYWGADADADSLVYLCNTGGNPDYQNRCQDPNEVTTIAFLEENPPSGEAGICNGIDIANDSICELNSNSTDCFAQGDYSCLNIGDENGCQFAIDESFCNNFITDNGLDCEWNVSSICEWEWTFGDDVTNTGLWIAQNHPASITPSVETGNENLNAESYPGLAWGVVNYGTSSIFNETFIQGKTFGLDGIPLVIDSRGNHNGGSLLLPTTPDASITANANPGFGFLQLPAPDDILDVQVTGTLIDEYGFEVDGGTLAINVVGATVLNSCDGIDSNGDGITGSCVDGDGETIFINTCSSCQESGFTWIFQDDDGDGIADDDPIFGITNAAGQVTWTIRYELGINECSDCDDAAAATCEDFTSAITISLLDAQQGTSPAVEVILIQPNPLDLCP